MNLGILFGLLFVANKAYADWMITLDALKNVPANNRIQFLINAAGYQAEEHSVVTDDGYILALHRIRRIDNNTVTSTSTQLPVTSSTPVLLSHGLLTNGMDWVISGRPKSIAFQLADEDFDVWIISHRGTDYSNTHVSLSPQLFNNAFWNFSFHEKGVFDLPAVIDHILTNTSTSQLHLIGHSEGTTNFFVMGSMRPEMNSKIKSMHALGPVAFMNQSKSPLLKKIESILDIAASILNMLGVSKFTPSNDLMISGGKLTCLAESPFPEVCGNALFLLSGYDSNKLIPTIIPAILETMTLSGSAKELSHYAQLIKSGKFRQWDYGLLENVQKYGSISPPNYNLAKVTAPVYLHYSDNDWLAGVQDVDELAGKVGNVAGKIRVPDSKFSHLDYQWALDAKELVYDRVISIMIRQ